MHWVEYEKLASRAFEAHANLDILVGRLDTGCVTSVPVVAEWRPTVGSATLGKIYARGNIACEGEH